MLTSTNITKITYFDSNNNAMRIYVTQSHIANEYTFQIINDADDQIEDIVTATYTRPNQISMVKRNGDVFNAGGMYNFLKKWINESIKARRQTILQSPYTYKNEEYTVTGEFGLFFNREGMVGVFEILKDEKKVDVVRIILYSNDDVFTHYEQVNTYLLYPDLKKYFENIMSKAGKEILKLDRLMIY